MRKAYRRLGSTSCPRGCGGVGAGGAEAAAGARLAEVLEAAEIELDRRLAKDLSQSASRLGADIGFLASTAGWRKHLETKWRGLCPGWEPYQNTLF